MKNLIKNNKNFFDDEEPSKEHLKNFKKLLGKDKKIFNFFILKIASIIIIFIFISFFVILQNEENDKKILHLKDISHEYEEMEFYFAKQIDEQFSYFNKFSEEERKKDWKL